MNKSNTIYAVGIGPGDLSLLAPKAKAILLQSDVIVGYTKYVELINDIIDNQEIVSTGMKHEIDRCRIALSKALEGKMVSVISSGDAGIYAMAGLLFEMMEEEKYSDLNLEVIPGITAATAAAAVLGAPLMNDFATISLSDLLTPKEVILKRIKAIAEADMVCILYNPRSKKRTELFEQVINIFKEKCENKVFGTVKNVARNNQETHIGYLNELAVDQVDMCTVVVIGNSNTVLKNNRIYTTRGYKNKYDL